MIFSVLQFVAVVGMLLLAAGVAITTLSGRSLGIILGPMIAGKALALLCVVFTVFRPDRMELLSSLLIVVLFFSILLSVVGIAVLVRSNRFPEGREINAAKAVEESAGK